MKLWYVALAVYLILTCVMFFTGLADKHKKPKWYDKILATFLAPGMIALSLLFLLFLPLTKLVRLYDARRKKHNSKR